MMFGPPPPVKWTWFQGIFFTIICGGISFLFTWPKIDLMGFAGCALFGFLIANLEFTESPLEALGKERGDIVGWCFLVLLVVSLVMIWVYVTGIVDPYFLNLEGST